MSDFCFSTLYCATLPHHKRTAPLYRTNILQSRTTVPPATAPQRDDCAPARRTLPMGRYPAGGAVVVGRRHRVAAHLGLLRLALRHMLWHFGACLHAPLRATPLRSRMVCCVPDHDRVWYALI